MTQEKLYQIEEYVTSGWTVIDDNKGMTKEQTKVKLKALIDQL